jgi:methionyl aminopeptidase
MTLAIEPMVNAGKPAVKVLGDGWTAVTKDRALSAHFEHTVVVTEDGCRVLTMPADTAVDADGASTGSGPSRAESSHGRAATAAG